MATDVGSARVEITGDLSRFASQVRRDLNRILSGIRIDPVEVIGDFDRVEREARDATNDIERQFERSGEQAEDALREVGNRGEREFDRIEREARDAGGGMRRALTGAAVGIGAAFAAVQVGQFLGDAVTEAADLEESINAVSVVLGDAAGSFLSFGEDAATQLGITQAALNEAVVPIGSLLSNAGLSGEELSGNLQDLAGRATDVASVFNADVNQVLEAFGAALRGETEPIRQFGVNLNQAAIDAKAVELGLADANGEVDQSARLQAALALAMEQTESAAGDFANTANSLPNLLRTFNAVLDEAQATIGEALLPSLTELVQAVLPAIESLTPVFTSLGEVLGGVVEQAAPLVEVLGEALSEGLDALLPAVEPLGGAFLSLIEALAPLLPVIGRLLGTVLPPLAEVLGSLAEAIAPVVELIADHMTEALERWEPLLPPIVDLLGRLLEALGGALLDILTAQTEAYLELADALLPLAPELIELLEALLPLIPPLAEITSALIPLLVEVIAAVLPVLLPLITVLTRFATAVLENTVIPAVEALAALLTGDFSGALDIVRGRVDAFRDLVGRAFSAMRNIARDRINDLIGLVRSMPDRILRALGNLGNLLAGVGRDVINGFIDGIESAFGRVQDTLNTLTSFLPDWKGPAEVDRSILRQSGRDVMRGFQAGIDDQAASIESQLRDITSDLPTFAGPVSGGDGAVTGTLSSDQALVIENHIEIGGEVVRVVRTEINEHDRDLAQRVRSGTGAAR